MFKKLKKIFFNIKALIVLLIVLIVVGWGLTIYFGVKINSRKDVCTDHELKTEKLNYYVQLLQKSRDLIDRNQSLVDLEDEVRLLDNGVLTAEWENAVATNRKEDANNYLDVIIDALVFFSK